MPHPDAPYLHRPRRGVGRPTLPPGEKLQAITLRLTQADIDKLKDLGGRAWLSDQLAKVTRWKAWPRKENTQ